MNNETDSPPRDISRGKGTASPPWVLWCGLATSGLTLAGVWAVARATEFDLMGWYFYFVLPIGALLVGMLAGSGYALAAWLLNQRISKAMLWCVAGLQVVVYFAAQYIQYRNEIAGWEDTTGVSFWAYFDFYTRAFAFQEDDGSAGEAMGMWGYAFRALEIAGFTFGGIVAPLLMRLKPYCDACGIYMNTRTLGLIPAGIVPRKVKKSDTEGQEQYEQDHQAALAQGLEVVEELAATAAAGDVEQLERTLAPYIPDTKQNNKLTTRIQIELHQCPRCAAGQMVAMALTGAGDQTTREEIVRIDLNTPLPEEEVEEETDLS